MFTLLMVEQKELFKPYIHCNRFKSIHLKKTILAGTFYFWLFFLLKKYARGEDRERACVCVVIHSIHK